MRRRRWLKIAAAIYIVWVALTVGELWPFQRVFDVPPEYWENEVSKDIFAGPRLDISPREAHLLWVVRDPEPADGTLEVFARNFNTMLSRSRPLELPMTIPLDILTLIFGESFSLIRLIANAATGIILAAATYFILWPLAAAGLQRHRRRPTLWPLLFGGLFFCAVSGCFLGILWYNTTCGAYGDQFHSAVDSYIASYDAGEPVITIFDEDSRFAYFDATRDLRLGNRIDLSQRQYTSSEINVIIEDINDDRIWLLFERGAPYLDANLDAAIEALDASGKGRPFVQGPLSAITTSKLDTEFLLNDYWQIYGYDANYEFRRPFQRSDVLLCS